MKEIKLDIKTEHIQALLEGKKMVYEYAGLPRITLYPDRYGVFMTYEKLKRLRSKIAFTLATNPDELLKEILGDEYQNFIARNN